MVLRGALAPVLRSHAVTWRRMGPRTCHGDLSAEEAVDNIVSSLSLAASGTLLMAGGEFTFPLPDSAGAGGVDDVPDQRWDVFEEEIPQLGEDLGAVPELRDQA